MNNKTMPVLKKVILKKVMRSIVPIIITLATTLPSIAAAAPTAELGNLLEQRLAGDRSAVCVAAVKIAEKVEHATFCADTEKPRAMDADSRFEIGSVSKAFLGLLVARLIEDEQLSLQQTVTELLPGHANVPDFNGEPIRIIHLLTHTSGLPRLPSNLEVMDPANPYSSYTPEDLLDGLADIELSSAPGNNFEYSNLGYMLLSLALSQHMDTPLAELFGREIFQPLGMDQTSMDGPTIPGHAAGVAVSNWDIHPDLGGVGAIRSTPADLARWLEAVLKGHGGPLDPALGRARSVLLEANGQALGYGWIHAPIGDRMVMIHDGGTGGFSSFAVADPDQNRASLVLMDTSMVQYGSLSDLALHLVDSQMPLAQPRLAVGAPEGIDLHDYAGRFALFDGDQPFMGDFVVEFSVVADELMVQASSGGQVQPQLPMVPDGEDRFVITEIDLVIEFKREASEEVKRLDFSQGQLQLRGERL